MSSNVKFCFIFKYMYLLFWIDSRFGRRLLLCFFFKYLYMFLPAQSESVSPVHTVNLSTLGMYPCGLVGSLAPRTKLALGGSHRSSALFGLTVKPIRSEISD